MALVAKRNRIMAPMNSQRGQISIFFSASLIVFISIIAFVINVGLFVKAKINLQNATDAAAFSGAAVQARQLTKIAYLNWEMRNIYKEWMYKYYVVGSLNTPMVENQGAPGNSCDGRECMDFRLEGDIDTLAVPPRKIYDPYNIPAVCIHITGSLTNICKRYAVPGLPEFGGYSIPGTEEASRSFIDILIGEKVNDCIMRSKINMLATATWAYNVLPTGGEDTLAGRGPAILTDRQGAWPRAMELAMRIRNLELVMNREPADGPVGLNEIQSVYETENKMGNERIVKAFYSGFRNLGNATDNEMKASFKLTELAPEKSGKPSATSNGGLLIPALYEKRYVDLRIMLVNLATFYAALIPRSEKDKSGACDISKVALPVPGYPLGFYKHPDIVTYYAVKGEAEFVGMFNPFSDETITLRAYAAAKPAGGRIGPMLFTQSASDSVLRPRTEKKRSVPYILSLDVVDTPNPLMPSGKIGQGEYGPGVPLPVNLGTTPADKPFWIVDAASPVGGIPSGEAVYFGMPNLVYDFDKQGASFSDANYTVSGTSLLVIRPVASHPPTDYDGDRAIGLYNREQFVAFRGKVGGNVTPEILVNQISRVKAATRYEAANYLIPTGNDFNKANNVDSFGMMGNSPEVLTVDGEELKRYNASIYAPLYSSSQEDVLWKTNDEVVTTLVQFMTLQQFGLRNYVHALNKAAIQTYQTALNNSSVAAQNAIDGFEKAAKAISEIDVKNTDPDYFKSPAAFPSASCDSLAAQFWHYYYGDPVFGLETINQTPVPPKVNTCPTTLVSLLRSYYAQGAADPTYSASHYKMEYNYYGANWHGLPRRIYSAYMPGPFNGIDMAGKFVSPFGLDPEEMQRNFYSTKFIMLSSLKAQGKYDEGSNFSIYSEGEISSSGSGSTGERRQGRFANPLNTSDFSFIKH